MAESGQEREEAGIGLDPFLPSFYFASLLGNELSVPGSM